MEYRGRKVEFRYEDKENGENMLFIPYEGMFIAEYVFPSEKRIDGYWFPTVEEARRMAVYYPSIDFTESPVWATIYFSIVDEDEKQYYELCKDRKAKATDFLKPRWWGYHLYPRANVKRDNRKVEVNR